MTPSLEHATFVIERTLPVSAAHAFRFWSERMVFTEQTALLVGLRAERIASTESGFDRLVDVIANDREEERNAQSSPADDLCSSADPDCNKP